MSLMSLPNELLIHIAKSGCMLTTSGLLKCNRRLYNLLITDWFQHIRDFHTAFYARVRDADGEDVFCSMRVRAVHFLRDLESKAWGVDESTRQCFGFWGENRHAVQDLVGPKTLLNPRSCLSLIDVAAADNPLRALLFRHDLHNAQMLLNSWLHPTCLLTVPIDCLKTITRYNGAPDIFEFLKKNGVQVDARADDLRKAICDQDEPTVERLLKQGAGRTFPDQCTFFSQAIPTGNAKLVEPLSRFGVKLCPFQDTPFQKAVGNMQIVELLLKQNVLPDHYDNALQIAVSAENIPMIKLLFKYNVRSFGNLKIKKIENMELLKLLLNNNVKPSCSQATSAFTEALLAGRKDVVELLIKNDIKPLIYEKSLADAIRKGNRQAGELFFKHGARASPSDKAVATRYQHIRPDLYQMFQEEYKKQKELETRKSSLSHSNKRRSAGDWTGFSKKKKVDVIHLD